MDNHTNELGNSEKAKSIIKIYRLCYQFQLLLLTFHLYNHIPLMYPTSTSPSTHPAMCCLFTRQQTIYKLYLWVSIATYRHRHTAYSQSPVKVQHRHLRPPPLLLPLPGRGGKKEKKRAYESLTILETFQLWLNLYYWTITSNRPTATGYRCFCSGISIHQHHNHPFRQSSILIIGLFMYNTWKCTICLQLCW